MGDPMIKSSAAGQIETINDIEMYYEIRGEGEPLLLLHGGGGIGANWELIFNGDRDPLYPVGLAMEMYEAIPDSYLWVVPNGGHGPFFGDLTALFVERALAFFAEGMGGIIIRACVKRLPHQA